MDKTLLKNFAIYSRDKLIQDTKNKASIIEITEEGIGFPLPESTSEMLLFDIGGKDPYILTGERIRQYEKLKEELERREENSDYETAYETLIEEVAYTWFNRLISIRFMEANNYMPNRMRVLSSGREGVNEPEIVTNYLDSELDFTDEELEKLSEWRMDGSAPAMDNMFNLLFIKQCNELNKNLPELFEQTDDYAELLLTISYNDPEGVLYKLVNEIPEEYFDVQTDDRNGQVEIIGWMYQYYNTELKDEIFARPRSQKIPKEDIPAVTQLFTPDWIVRYMVQNSLGRLWIEKLLASGDKRSEKEIADNFGWKYYIPEAEQDEEVKEELIEIRNEIKDLQLEDITFMDPAMGSFHIGVYAFDVFMQLYESQGYTNRDAARSIIENNLYGIDIDKRAYQLSYFACMMKAREHNRRILNSETKTNLYTINESNDINRQHLDYLGKNVEDEKEWEKQKENIIEILDIFTDAKEYGSILKIENEYEYGDLKTFILSSKENIQVSFETVGIENTQKDILYIIILTEILSNKYDVVSTNPPYLGSRGMNKKLSAYLNKNYSNSKRDLFSVFMERCKEFTNINGLYSMITQHSWMFLSSYENLREELQKNTIINMLHFGTRAFEEIGGEVVQTTSFVLKNESIDNYIGSYIRLVDFNNAEAKRVKTLEAIENPNCGYYYETNEKKFELIPGTPLAYWASERIYEIYKSGKILDKIGEVKSGISPGDTNNYLRLWHEVNKYKSDLRGKDIKEIKISKLKWFQCNKGGTYRKWYGNKDYLINWEENGKELKEFERSYIRNLDYQFKEHIGYSRITSSDTSFRFYSEGNIFTDSSSGIFYKNIYYMIAYLNTKVPRNILKFLNPTMNFQAGDIKSLPFKLEESHKPSIDSLVRENINISKSDWDSFETSWNFEIHPLLDMDKQLKSPNKMEESYKNWKEYANNNFDQLKENEEELNRIFIEIYGLEDELTPEVSDKDITVTKIFDHKDEIYEDIKGNRYIKTKEDVVKSFISYAVGCMFGRYSLDEEGLVYAGGQWDGSKYESFRPVEDNVILITDEEYSEDDIVNRFVQFVKVVYGEKTLEENLEFIADSLTGSGSPREKIRNYFMNNFYKDHIQTYKKHPIYWMYDSSAGKTRRQSEDGFKALIYMHRYDQDTTGRVRMDYLHKLQRAYELRMDNLQYIIDNNENSREVGRAEKELDDLTKKLKECRDYDEKIGHLALGRISIDLDDGVKVNYQKIQTDGNGKKLKILTKI